MNGVDIWGRSDALAGESEDTASECVVELSDDSFEEYLNGGTALSRAYSEIESSKVPQKVELSVLRRARTLASLRALLQTETWVSWSTPVALAACTLVMVAVLLEGVVPFMRAQAQLVMVQLGERPASAAAPAPSVPTEVQNNPEQRVARLRRERDQRAAALRLPHSVSAAASSERTDEPLEDMGPEGDARASSDTAGFGPGE